MLSLVWLSLFCKGSIRSPLVAHISNQTTSVLLELFVHLVLHLDELYLAAKLDRFF